MKSIQYTIVSVAFIALFFSISTFSAEAVVRTKGYLKPSNGTYVAPHFRSQSNNTQFDNYSTKGNYNPYTGRKGYLTPSRNYRLK